MQENTFEIVDALKTDIILLHPKDLDWKKDMSGKKKLLA